MSDKVPSVDDLQGEVLQDYNNQVDRDGNKPDTSKGSLTYIDSTVIASCVQGIHFRIARAEGRALPNLGSSTIETILEWAGVYPVDIDEQDTDADIVRKIYERIQNPPAGGNDHDWKTWADAISVIHTNSDGTTFTEQSIYPDPIDHFRYPGSIDLFLYSDWNQFPVWSPSIQYQTGDLVFFDSISVIGEGRIYECLSTSQGNLPGAVGSENLWSLLEGCSNTLATEARAKIELLRVMGLWDILYRSASISIINVDAEVTGPIDVDIAKNLVTAFVNGTKTGKQISHAQLSALLVQLGAETVNLNQPSNNIVGATGVKPLIGSVNIIKV